VGRGERNQIGAQPESIRPPVFEIDGVDPALPSPWRLPVAARCVNLSAMIKASMQQAEGT